MEGAQYNSCIYVAQAAFCILEKCYQQKHVNRVSITTDKSATPLQVFSDQSHVLRNYLSEQGMVSIRITGGGEHPSTFSKVHPFIKLYPNGVAQPGLVCIKPDRSVLFSWAIEPSLVGGQ